MSRTFWLKPSDQNFRTFTICSICRIPYSVFVGYDKESTKIEGLEEYWDYNVKVTATTSVASVVSDQLETIRTLPTRNFISTLFAPLVFVEKGFSTA